MIIIKDNILKGLRFYSSVISKNIPLFMVIGITSILFSNSGFFPNNTLAFINSKIYTYMVPIFIAYTAGFKIADNRCALISSLSGLCLAIMVPKSAIILSVVSGTLFAYLSKYILDYMDSRDKSEGFEMITSNLTVTILCIISICLTYIVISPVSYIIEFIILKTSVFLSSIKAIPVLSMITETLKVFFLNNSINHGMLIPAAMNTISKTGKSALFLMETNPGPGLGLLMAYFLKEKKRRKYYSSCMTVQAIGGIHEIYFPIAASNPLTITALIFGGMAGNFIFRLTNTGAVGAISPGSIITILMMCKFNDWTGLIFGIVVSALTSFTVSYLILCLQGKRNTEDIENISDKTCTSSSKQCSDEIDEALVKEYFNDIDVDLINDNSNNRYLKTLKDNFQITSKDISNDSEYPVSIGYVEDIAFVCDLGVGSSVMASSIFKRKLEESGLKNISVSAYSIDNISEDSDLIICQKGFKSTIEEYMDFIPIIEIDNFMSGKEYDKIIEIIGNGG